MVQPSIIDGLISLALGIWTTMVGFGWTTLSDDPVKQAKTMSRFGWWFRILGPAIAVWGGVSIVKSLA